MALLTYFGGVAAVIGIIIYRIICIPSNLPKSIPAVPIYISLIGLWSDMGQDEIYDRWLRQPLEKYGAIKIWFAGRWNLLITRPEYLSDMLKHEDIFAKAGSQKKIPWSVMASLVGDNIINSHGENWKLYTSIMKPGLQKTNFDSRPILDKSRKFVDLLLKMQSDIGKNSGVLVNPIVQRFAIAAMGESFLDIDFECLEQPNMRIELLQSIIKRTIFKPLYFNFPVLDMYPSIFRSRRRAFAIMKEFEDLLYDLVRNRPRKLSRKEPVKPEDELVVHMLERALDTGAINEEQFRANLKITFLTAHENTQQLLNSAFWQLGSNQVSIRVTSAVQYDEIITKAITYCVPYQAIQDKLRAEVLATNVTNPTSETLNKLPYLTSLICELLRVYPPVSQLINRVSLEPYLLGGKLEIPKGTWVGWNAPGVQSSEAAWGKTARQFIPERWGDKPEDILAKARRETVRGRYIAFNAYNRKCLGQGYAILEMKMVLFELVRRLRWTVDPTYKLKLTSGGILAPLGCKIIFEELDVGQIESKNAMQI